MGNPPVVMGNPPAEILLVLANKLPPCGVEETVNKLPPCGVDENANELPPCNAFKLDKRNRKNRSPR